MAPRSVFEILLLTLVTCSLGVVFSEQTYIKRVAAGVSETDMSLIMEAFIKVGGAIADFNKTVLTPFATFNSSDDNEVHVVSITSICMATDAALVAADNLKTIFTACIRACNSEQPFSRPLSCHCTAIKSLTNFGSLFGCGSYLARMRASMNARASERFGGFQFEELVNQVPVFFTRFSFTEILHSYTLRPTAIVGLAGAFEVLLLTMTERQHMFGSFLTIMYICTYHRLPGATSSPTC